MSFTEATVEAATLDWFGELGYDQKYGPDVEPGELYAERAGGDVGQVLVGDCRLVPRRVQGPERLCNSANDWNLRPAPDFSLCG